jgi:uncharacterized protein (TIGR02246 family)
VDALRALENALLEFAGCTVVISRDRWFLDRIGAHILASRMPDLRMSTVRPTCLFVLAVVVSLAAVSRLGAQHTGAAAGDSTAVPVDARATIDSVNAAWLPTVQRNDAAAIADPYADDGLLVTATGETFGGRAAVEQAMRESLAGIGAARVGGRLVQDGITHAGNLIYEWGHAELEITRPGAEPAHATTRYLTVWRQDATGRWRILRNLSLP